MTQEALSYLERTKWERGWTRSTATSWQTEILEVTPTQLIIDLVAGWQKHVNGLN